MKKHFENLFVFGRPASGKSEFIDFMKKCEPSKRLEDFHVAPLEFMDDYLFLTEIAEHEDVLEKINMPVKRLTKRTSDGIAVCDDLFWDFAIEKMNRIALQKYLPRKDFYNEKTLLIEFSRGVGRSGYSRTLSGLRNEILGKGAVIFVKVSFEESLRRNNARYQEKLKHSVLAHKCPEEIMYRYYKDNDWDELTSSKSSGVIDMNGLKVPFVTMNNEPELKEGPELYTRYKTALDKLAELV